MCTQLWNITVENALPPHSSLVNAPVTKLSSVAVLSTCTTNFKIYKSITGYQRDLLKMRADHATSLLPNPITVWRALITCNVQSQRLSYQCSHWSRPRLGLQKYFITAIMSHHTHSAGRLRDLLACR